MAQRAGEVVRATASAPPASVAKLSKLPLVVDMDRFLVKADLDTESVVTELERTVARMSRAIRGERGGVNAATIAEFARRGPDVSNLPLQQDLVDYLIASHESGRPIHLITSAAQEIADAVAARLGVFESATGASLERPMGEAQKLAHATARFPQGFAYAGRAASLIDAAHSVVLAQDDRSARTRVARRGTQVEIDVAAPGHNLKVWIKALRCHQWSKNALLFVPLMLGHAWADLNAIASCVAGFLLLSFLASGTYLVNDILDLDADRKHPTKRRRPLARGDIKVGTAMAVAGLAIAGGLAGAFLLNTAFFVTLAAYLATTLAYSFWLKRMMLVDVFVLAVLFTSRIAMGIALAGVAPSPWLLTFTMFFFLSLSLAKRHVEIVNAADLGLKSIPGRDYRASDLPLTVALGVGCNAVAMLVMFLYLTHDAMPTGFYRQPYWLWGAAFVVFLWSLRIWGLSHRGKLDADPVAFAIKDKVSILLGTAVLAVFGLAV